MGKKKAKKKAKRETRAEKRLARLKKTESELEKQSAALNKKLERERKAGQKEIDRLDKQIEKLEAKRDAIYERPLPSQKKFNKVEDQLLGVRNTLRDIGLEDSQPPPSDAKRRHEAGDVDEEE